MTTIAEPTEVLEGRRGRARRFGPYITIATVLAVLAAAGITLFGLGAFDHAVASYDPAAWLFSRAKGEVGRVNGSTAKVDTRVKVTGTAGHKVSITQTDRYLIVRDIETGVVSALDLTTLQIAGSVNTTPGVGVKVALHGQFAYVIDTVHGELRQLDPLTLNPLGQPIDFAPGLQGGDFDSDGKLWMALPSQGTVVSVTPPAKTGDTPAVASTSVAPPNHDLAVSVMDKGVAVLDQTADQLITVAGQNVAKTDLPIDDQTQMAPRTSGDKVPVTVPDSRSVFVVDNHGGVKELKVPGSGNQLSAAVAWAGWFYVADATAGEVYVLDGNGALVDQIRFPGQSDIELQVRDDYLYINALDGSTARVVDRDHKVSTVDKYPNNVPGGDPPPPVPPSAPPAPVVGPPSAPATVTASAGNTTAHVSWSAANPNNAPVTKYVVEGGPAPVEVGANQRAIDITGLTNGTAYTFTVYAVNSKGKGPKKAANPVTPTAEVPDPPASITAQAQKDGTVTLTWPAGNGQGHQIANYQITATGPDGSLSAGQAPGSATTFPVPAGTLKYGTQYAFSVSTINDKGTGSKASPLSNSVVPFTVPDKPANLTAAASTTAKGTVTVAWGAPASNGKPITGYTVTANGTAHQVTGTSTTLSGFANNASVSVSVVATNAAGNSAVAGPTTAKTIAAPTVTLTGKSVGYNSITADFTANAGGATSLTCKMAVAGESTVTASCTAITVGGLAPGTAYSYTVTVTNAAGSASATGSATTTALNGTVRCVSTNGYCDSGVGIYSKPMQDSSATTNWDGHNGKRYPAYCKITGGDGNAQADATLTAAGYNNNKTSKMWVKISNSPVRYIPWIWFNLDSGDDLGMLPTC